MIPQVSLSPDLVGMVEKRENYIVHSVSPLVLMVLFMYATILTTEFRCFRDFFNNLVVTISFVMYNRLIT